MPHRWVTSAVGLGPFWRPHPPHSLGWQQAQLKACSAMLGSFGVHPPFSEPQFPHRSRGGGPGDFLRPFLPHAVEMLIQVKRPPSQLHPVSAPCPQGHRAFGPGTWGMGVAALTLSMWLPDQRKTNSRAQRGVVSKHHREGKAPAVSNTQGILPGVVHQIPACPQKALLVAKASGPWGTRAAPHTTDNSKAPTRLWENQGTILSPAERMPPV